MTRELRQRSWQRVNSKVRAWFDRIMLVCSLALIPCAVLFLLLSEVEVALICVGLAAGNLIIRLWLPGRI